MFWTKVVEKCLKHVFYVYNIFRHVCKVAKSYYYYLCYICRSVRTEKRGSHWTDFDDILHLKLCRKSVGKIQVS
jgi:hypothetical protein